MKKLILIIGILSIALTGNAQLQMWLGGESIEEVDPSAFITTWNTTITTGSVSASNQIALPLVSSGTYNFDVDWGDGNSDNITTWNQSETTHTYSSGGTYTVTITGIIEGWTFNNGGDKTKLITVEQFGDFHHGSTLGWFYGCSNMTAISGDYRYYDEHTNYTNNWRNCTSLVSFPLVDLSLGSSFASAWFGCSSLPSFPNINMSAATNVAFAWFGCSSLTSFPNINMNPSSYNSTWRNCNSLTSFEVGFGENMNNATDCGNMLLGATLSTTAYSRLLEEVESVNSNSSVTFHGGSSKYNATNGATARAALIADHGWTITDGGLE